MYGQILHIVVYEQDIRVVGKILRAVRPVDKAHAQVVGKMNVQVVDKRYAPVVDKRYARVVDKTYARVVGKMYALAGGRTFALVFDRTYDPVVGCLRDCISRNWSKHDWVVVLRK